MDQAQLSQGLGREAVGFGPAAAAVHRLREVSSLNNQVLGIFQSRL